VLATHAFRKVGCAHESQVAKLDELFQMGDGLRGVAGAIAGAFGERNDVHLANGRCKDRRQAFPCGAFMPGWRSEDLTLASPISKRNYAYPACGVWLDKFAWAVRKYFREITDFISAGRLCHSDAWPALEEAASFLWENEPERANPVTLGACYVFVTPKETW
jgi:hypothetical protein